MRYIYLAEFADEESVAFSTKEDAYIYVCKSAEMYLNEKWKEDFEWLTKEDFIRSITQAYEADRGFCFGVTGICTITAIRFYDGGTR